MKRSLVVPLLVTSVVAALAACSSSSGGNPQNPQPSQNVDAGGTDAAPGKDAAPPPQQQPEAGPPAQTDAGDGGSTPPAGPTWTVVDLINDPAGGNEQVQKGAATVSGIWFSDVGNGDVALIAGSGALSGAIEHLDKATHVDAVALSGYDAAPGPQHDNYISFWSSPSGLVAFSENFGDEFITSSDKGKTFKNGPIALSGPNTGGIWISADPSGAWHYVDHTGNVWAAASAPGAQTAWTRTWQPEASPPVPDPLPAADCTGSFHQGYFAFDPQQVFWASPDGMTMLYGKGYGSEAAGVCRSTDGGKNFVPVDFPAPPADSAQSTPYVIVFTSATHGIAARSNELSPAGSAYAYTTDDGGATWKAATLPASVASKQYALTNGFAAPDGQHVWLGGFDHDSMLVLFKSSDGGKTWTDASAKLNATVKQGFYKLHSGFALDANNIWVGGDYGGLVYSPTGGE